MAQRPQHGKPLEKMGEFLRLKPPTFSGSQDPMEAEDWMRTIEMKLELLHCNEETNIALATHQLSGTALAWWEIVKAAHKEGITWKEFAEVFQEVSSDGEKCKAFRKGLTLEIATLAYTYRAPNFASLISYAIKAEKLKREERSQLKRKFMEFKTQRQELRQRQFAGQASRGSFSAPFKSIDSAPSRFGPTQGNSQQNTFRSNGLTCYNCGESGHFIASCPHLYRGKQAASTFSNSVNGPRQPTATGNRPAASV
ncbi:hypothetical protein BS78_06G055900 [Paspalum vaginatum]|nr:hypothetical protein BS78_06G055900 [Paspalum vaginatum]